MWHVSKSKTGAVRDPVALTVSLGLSVKLGVGRESPYSRHIRSALNFVAIHTNKHILYHTLGEASSMYIVQIMFKSNLYPCGDRQPLQFSILYVIIRFPFYKG